MGVVAPSWPEPLNLDDIPDYRLSNLFCPMDLLYLPVLCVTPMTSSPCITSSPCRPLGLFTVSLSSPPLTRPLTPLLRASCHLLTYASSQKGVVALAVVLALQRMLYISPRGLQGQAFLGVCCAWELKCLAPNSGISAHPTDILRLTSVKMYYRVLEQRHAQEALG